MLCLFFPVFVVVDIYFFFLLFLWISFFFFQFLIENNGKALITSSTEKGTYRKGDRFIFYCFRGIVR